VLELVSTTDLGTATEAGWRVLADDGTYTLIGYDAKAKQIFVDRTKSGNVSFSDKFPARTAAPFDAGGQLKLHVLLDRMSVEVFAGDGQVAMTNLVFPAQDATKLDFYSNPGPVQKNSFSAWKIRSIW
jgi:sucrose-6-phosphate hydrolase SacC (GH32 family)